jgi:hypothetical protein
VKRPQQNGSPSSGRHKNSGQGGRGRGQVRGGDRRNDNDHNHPLKIPNVMIVNKRSLFIGLQGAQEKWK